ncbi:MAG: DUF6596 domain-containing protein [Pseudomonadota bacterium]
MTLEARMADVMRASYGRLLAILSSRTNDILLAEDALSDAFAKALIHWPDTMPRNPEAWLLTVARNRLTDLARRDARIEFHDEVPQTGEAEVVEDGFPDERLKLMFVCAHPAIDPRLHTPLMLQTVLGLEAEAIAQAFLVPHSTMAKRLVRAKRKIRDAGVAFQIPQPEDLGPRLSAVLEAVYGAFSRDWLGAGALAEEALYLASLLVDLLPQEPEALGLAALIAYTASREEARVLDGVFVPLEEQDTSKWDTDLLTIAQDYLAQAQALNSFGRFQLEAAIQAVHADRLTTGVTNWDALVQLHLGLSRIAPTIGATVGYAAALGKAVGPKEGLEALCKIDATVRATFAPAEATRAYLLSELGETQAALAAYQRALSLTTEPPLRQFLQMKYNVLSSAAPA